MPICLFRWFPALFYNLETLFHIGTICTTHVISSMILPCLSSLISFIPLLSMFLSEGAIAIYLLHHLVFCPKLLIFQLFSPSDILSPSASLPTKLFLLLHLLTEKAFHNSCTCFYLIQTDFLKSVNKYLRSPPNWINLLRLLYCHWDSSLPPSTRQSFPSLTSLLLAFTIVGLKESHQDLVSLY